MAHPEVPPIFGLLLSGPSGGQWGIEHLAPAGFTAEQKRPVPDTQPSPLLTKPHRLFPSASLDHSAHPDSDITHTFPRIHTHLLPEPSCVGPVAFLGMFSHLRAWAFRPRVGAFASTESHTMDPCESPRPHASQRLWVFFNCLMLCTVDKKEKSRLLGFNFSS